MGLIPPDSGAVTGIGRVGAVFQEDRLIEHLSAVQNLTLTGVALRDAERHLTELALGESLRGPVSKFSGGMKRRVARWRARWRGPAMRRCWTNRSPAWTFRPATSRSTTSYVTVAIGWSCWSATMWRKYHAWAPRKRFELKEVAP